jgi:tetratricopeptide (TPR) repeat protein
MGVAYAMLNEFDKALEAYEKAIVLNSELIIKLSKQQNWYPLEQWINNLTDNDKKQQYLHTLKILKVISLIIIRLNLNGFFISLNCLLKLI